MSRASRTLLFAGVAGAGVGAALAASRRTPSPVALTQAVTVARRRSEVYAAWKAVDGWPRAVFHPAG